MRSAQTTRTPAIGSAPQPLERSLADWVAALRYEELPPATIACAKRLMLDTLACGWAGSAADGVDAARKLARAQGGHSQARVWATSESVPSVQAALINGVMAAALDFDSVHDDATVHADAVVLPALLAIAEPLELSTHDFLAAYVAGDELLVRLGMGIQQHPGWFFTSVLGGMAAAAACAKALGLGADGIQTAMGIALSRAAGTQQSLLERSLTKRYQSAFAARDGVEAAQLASFGVTAPAAFLNGPAAFGKLYSSLDCDRMLEGLGQDYRFLSISLKKYASCLCNHGIIEAALHLQREHGVSPRDVRDVTLSVTPFVARLVGAEFDPGSSPQVAAQFSAQYSMANVLLRDRFSVQDIEESSVRDPAIAALAKRITVKVDADLAAGAGPVIKSVPVRVALRTVDGREIEAIATILPGSPAAPLSQADVRAKANECFMRGLHSLKADEAASFIHRIERFETLPTVSSLWN